MNENSSVTQNDSQSSSPSPFYVGTYTDGDSQGIYKFLFHADGTLTNLGLAANSTNPSFLARNKDSSFLLAINEVVGKNDLGSIQSFIINGDTLDLIDQKASGGSHPCFVAINRDGYILTANYTGGNVCLLKQDDQGLLSDILDTQQHTGAGTSERQDAPHAHSSWFVPNSEDIISVDLGTNQLWFSRIDPDQNKLVPSTPITLDLDEGDGPRHLAFHPDNKWFYVVNELNSTITIIHRDKEGGYTKGASCSALPNNYVEPNTCSDIHLSSDGKYLYVANRGHDSIAVFRVSFVDGELKLLGHKSSGGISPRNFSLSPKGNYLLVANQKSNNIVVLKRDVKSGLLKYRSQLETPSPVCLLF